MITSFQEQDTKEFGRLLEYVKQDDIGKETWVVPLADWSINTDFDKTSGAWKYEGIRHSGPEVKNAVFTPFAFDQYCKRMKCPGKFMLTLPGNLAKSNLDYFKVDQKDKAVAVRVKWREDDQYDDNGFYFIRGVSSPNKAFITNRELLEALRPEAEREGMRVWKAQIRPHDFAARLIWGQDINVGTIQSPDNVNIGLSIRNSEVGAGPTLLDIVVFRLVCTNGMIAQVDNAPIFRQTANNMSNEQMRTLIANAVHTLKNRKDEIIGKFQDGRAVKLDNPELVLSRVCRKYNIGKVFSLGLAEEMHRGTITHEYEGTKICIVNVLTKYAQCLTSEDRYKMETIAGKVLWDEDILEGPVDALKEREEAQDVD